MIDRGDPDDLFWCVLDRTGRLPKIYHFDNELVTKIQRASEVVRGRPVLRAFPSPDDMEVPADTGLRPLTTDKDVLRSLQMLQVDVDAVPESQACRCGNPNRVRFLQRGKKPPRDYLLTDAEVFMARHGTGTANMAIPCLPVCTVEEMSLFKANVARYAPDSFATT